MRHRLAAVLGEPVGHSLSPVIHGFWIRQHAVAATYAPIEIAQEDLAAFFALAPRIGFAGFNVTAPHKEAAFALCAAVSETARRSGSVNLVVFDAEGAAHGDSTDGFGFLESLAAAAGFDAAGKTAAIIGAGGAARAIIDALIDAGASEARLANRTRARAEATAALFEGRGRVVLGDATAAEFYDGADLVVNATSFGMTGSGRLEATAAPWRLPRLAAETVACDLIYAPLDTPFLRDAVAAGARPVDGLGMLLHQARPSFEAWFGVAVDAEAGLRAEVMRALDLRARRT